MTREARVAATSGFSQKSKNLASVSTGDGTPVSRGKTVHKNAAKLGVPAKMRSAVIRDSSSHKKREQQIGRRALMHAKGGALDICMRPAA